MPNSFPQIVSAASYLLQYSPAAEEARHYLNDRLNSTTQTQFGFGYLPNAANLGLLSALVSEEVLEANELLYTRDIQDAHSARSVNVCAFENHPLIMPYRDVYGNILALVGRSLLSEAQRKGTGISKYKNTQFIKGNHLFGLFEARQHILEAGFVYVVEGQFDVIKAWEKGLKNVVAVGSSDVSARQLALMCRYTREIRLLLDNDEAGRKGRVRAISKYGKLAEVKGVYLPEEFKDLDEYLGSRGAEELAGDVVVG